MEQYIAQVNDFNMIAKTLFIASKKKFKTPKRKSYIWGAIKSPKKKK
jgi:hypothetical protein